MSRFPPGALSVHIYLNAAGSCGCGAAALGFAYFKLCWPQYWESVGIAAKELLPLVIAAGLWGRVRRGHHVLFRVDNMSVVQMVRASSITCCAVSVFLMQFQAQTQEGLRGFG